MLKSEMFYPVALAAYNVSTKLLIISIKLLAIPKVRRS